MKAKKPEGWRMGRPTERESLAKRRKAVKHCKILHIYVYNVIWRITATHPNTARDPNLGRDPSLTQNTALHDQFFFNYVFENS